MMLKPCSAIVMAMDTTAHLSAAAPTPAAAVPPLPSAAGDERVMKTSLRAKKAKRLARHVLVRALIDCDGEIELAAKKTGLTPTSFSEQMRQYQLPRPIMYRPGIGKMPEYLAVEQSARSQSGNG